MKRERDDPDPCHNPVLAQLDFLINGPPKEARHEAPAEAPPPLLELPPPLHQDPALLQLDALINGTPMAAPALPAPPHPEDTVQAGPPGLFREFGGIKGWLRLRGFDQSQP